MNVGVLHGGNRAKAEVPTVKIVSGFTKGADFVAVGAPVGGPKQTRPAG